MEFNWKIVSTDDTTHSMTVAYWTTDHPEQIQVNIVSPPVGVDITEYVTRFVPVFDKPVMVYQPVEVGVEGTGTIISAPEIASSSLPPPPNDQIHPIVAAALAEALLKAKIQLVLDELADTKV